MGGSPTTAYNPTDLEDAPTHLQRMGEKVITDLNALIVAADNSCALWQGSSAKEAFLAHRQEWVDSVNQMSTILETRAVPALRNALENYNQNEHVNRLMWQH